MDETTTVTGSITIVNKPTRHDRARIFPQPIHKLPIEQRTLAA